MIHHIVLYKLKPEVSADHLEKIMMQTRMQLLKIPVATNVRCGRRIDQNNEWPFFFEVEFDSKERMAMFKEDPIYIKFVEETVKPNTIGGLVLDYETDPKRKYS
jgi:Stress responsive A/B Barrel Domain